MTCYTVIFSCIKVGDKFLNTSNNRFTQETPIIAVSRSQFVAFSGLVTESCKGHRYGDLY